MRGFRHLRPGRRVARWVLTAVLALAGCGRAHPPTPRTLALPVEVRSDTAGVDGGTMRLAPTLPLANTPARAQVWMARVSPVRAEIASPPLPSATRDTLDAPPATPPELALDPDLKPPLLRDRARLVLPRGARAGIVELDVRVDEAGRVSDAIRAGGANDSSLVAAAITCARSMRFRPAERGGRAVAVWCRQRFDLTPGGR